MKTHTQVLVGLPFQTGSVLAGATLDRLKELPDKGMRSAVCRPPYGLSDVSLAQEKAVMLSWLTDDPNAIPTGCGFVGKTWGAFRSVPARWAVPLFSRSGATILAEDGWVPTVAGMPEPKSHQVLPDTDPYEPEEDEGGRLIDFLEPATRLEATPEERVRQRVLRRLHLFYGYPKNTMRREAAITRGCGDLKDAAGNAIRADVVVYTSATARRLEDQGKIKFVVECKKPDAKSGYNQLVSYIFNTSAGGGMWTNGSDDCFYRRDPAANTLAPCPSLPDHEYDWTTVGRKTRRQLVHPRDVKTLLRKCHGKLHGIGFDGEEEDLTMDMVRIILAKAQDETGAGDYPRFFCTPEEYQSASGRAAVGGRVQLLFRKFADDNR